MDYTMLTNDDRYRMLQERLRQYEQRHFDATMNLQVTVATGGDGAELQKQLAAFETGAKIVKADLAKLTPPAGPAPRPTPQDRLAQRDTKRLSRA